MFKVEWSEKAKAGLAKIDRNKARKIENKVEKYLALDPYKNGEPLKGNLKGEWSYHWSSYRIIYEIKHIKLLILIVEVGDRKNIYQKLKRKF